MSSFTVSPMSQQIVLKAGETYHGSVKVLNPADATEDFYYKVDLSPYSLTNSDVADFQTMSDWSRIVEWTTLDNTHGVLKPNESKYINFTIKVPENAPAGGQYAMIGVSSDPQAKGEDSSVSNVVEMACLIYATIEGETVHEGKILENKTPGFIATGAPTTIITLENKGNVHEVATTKIKVKNVLTGEVLKFSEDDNDTYETLVMPESTRTVERELTGLPQLGIFEVTSDVSFLDSSLNNQTTIVICPIWFIVLVVATIASVVGMIFYSLHLRRKRNRRLSENA